MRLTPAFAVLLLSQVAPPEPPAMFRGGPGHPGVYSGGGPGLIGFDWRAATNGDVISSPTIVGQTVYVGSDDGGVYALALGTGTRRWRADVGSGVASTPAVGGGLVIVAARDGSISALDAATGTRRWRLATGAPLPFPWGHESGDYYLSSPALVNGVAVVGAGDGAVYAIDAPSGRVRWKTRTGGRVRSSPAVSGDRVFVGSADGCVYALDLATGAVRWRYETSGVELHSEKFGFDRRTIQSSPAVVGGVVYVGARDGFIYALDAASGALRWRYDHKISWIITSPAVSEGVVYAGSSDAHFVQALDTTGKELWRSETEGIVWASPAVADGMVYAPDGTGRVYAFDAKSGAIRWVFRTRSAIYSSPVIAGDLVVVGSTDGGVYALRANRSQPMMRAVYGDSSARELSHVRHGEETFRYFVQSGYRALDTTALAAFLRERVTDRAPSVVVFASDYLPAAAVDGDAGASLLRRYLDAGGKAIWLGAPPGFWPREMPAGVLAFDWERPAAILGVPHGQTIFDVRGARATPAGTSWGLPPRWRDAWGVAPAGVTQVLGTDEWGLAAAWVKNYGGAPGTGFVRVPPDDAPTIYLAAEYRPASG